MLEAMRDLRMLVLASALFVILVTGCSLGQTGNVRGGWTWPTPAPLPAGAVAVRLETEQIPPIVNPDVEYAACPLALLGPITIQLVDDQVEYRDAASGEKLDIVWQVGFTARRANVVEIVAPDGAVIVREGQARGDLAGGWFGGAFHVCMGQYLPQRAGG